MVEMAMDATDRYSLNDLIALEMGSLAAPRLTAESLNHSRDDLSRLRHLSGDSDTSGPGTGLSKPVQMPYSRLGLCCWD